MSHSSDTVDDPEEAVATLDAKGGTVEVFAETVQIQRSSRSMFESKAIPLEEVTDVEYSDGFLTGHLQLRQTGVDSDGVGLISHPIDENTLHFPRTERDAAHGVRDAILERINL